MLATADEWAQLGMPFILFMKSFVSHLNNCGFSLSDITNALKVQSSGQLSYNESTGQVSKVSSTSTLVGCWKLQLGRLPISQWSRLMQSQRHHLLLAQLVYPQALPLEVIHKHLAIFAHWDYGIVWGLLWHQMLRPLQVWLKGILSLLEWATSVSDLDTSHRNTGAASRDPSCNYAKMLNSHRSRSPTP